MERPHNLAGRAGSWSARHWKTATFGWLAFAVLAVVLGTLAGAKKLTDSQTASGESARAEKILENADYQQPASESVLVQSKTLTMDDLAFNSAVATVVQTLSNNSKGTGTCRRGSSSCRRSPRKARRMRR